MKSVGKYVWFGINIILALGFFGVFFYFTYPCFKTFDDKINFQFIGLVLIMLEGVVESFITCACADEDSAKCYFYLAVLSAAILAMAIQFGYMLDELNGIFAETDNPVAVVIGLIVSFVQLSLSPMLITKFSSWFILLISVVGDYESKAEFILPAVLIVVNIAMAIVAACVEMSSGLLIAYLSVFGVLSVVSFIAVLKQNDIV